MKTATIRLAISDNDTLAISAKYSNNWSKLEKVGAISMLLKRQQETFESISKEQAFKNFKLGQGGKTNDTTKDNSTESKDA